MPVRALVVKVGSSTLVDGRGRARRGAFDRLASELAAAANGGTPVVLVSSGAIALGLAASGRRTRSGRVHELQAASAIGQPELQRRWQRALSRAGASAAQVLLTAGDVHRRDAYVNARATLETLLRWRVVPVINENDSTSTDEIAFGDNDTLAAHVAVLLRARRLLLLTDTDGLYDRDPRSPGAQLLAEVSEPELLARLELDGRSSRWGSGGMRSKALAAGMAAAGGVDALIASGTRAGVILEAAAGRTPGTRFPANPSPLSAYKLWLRYGRPVRGRLTLDAGAQRAVFDDGTSLLPVGVTAVAGGVAAGDAVELAGPEGEVFAVGLSEYPAAELAGLAGRRGAGEAVHRDNLVIL
jgi:glutamate 5-kinase